VRGLNLLGEHATFVHPPLAVVYRVLGPLADVRFLLLVQSASLAWVGFLLHSAAHRRLGHEAALLVLVAYLFYPPLQYTWGEFYQPVALAMAPLVLAFHAVQEGRARAAVLWSAAALVCMENVAATTAALGVYALLTRRWRLGLLLLSLSAVYVAALLNVWFPWLNPGIGYVYGYRLFGDFAASLPDAVAYLAHPGHLLGRFATMQNARYLLGLLVPVGFLPLGAPAALATAAQLPLNLVSSWPYAHEIRYHYVALAVPFVFLSVIAFLSRLPAGSRDRRLASGLLLGSVVAGQILYAPPWLSYRGDEERRQELDDLIPRLSPELSVSASFPFLPHLCHRRRLFMFPDLGGHGGPLVEAVLFDVHLIGRNPAESEALFRLHANGFREVLHTPTGIVLYLRGDPAGRDLTSPLGPVEIPGGPPPARPPRPADR
jgi:Predicted membrane protein (DUF2079)